MVERLRKLVSGNRRRFTEDDFSLDLTYIVPGRIIAMSYPSHGFERLYRNSIEKVSSSYNELRRKANLLALIGLRLPQSETWKQVLYH